MPEIITQEETKTWKRAINPMLTKLGTDLQNHRMLADPWRRTGKRLTWLLAKCSK